MQLKKRNYTKRVGNQNRKSKTNNTMAKLKNDEKPNINSKTDHSIPKF